MKCKDCPLYITYTEECSGQVVSVCKVKKCNPQNFSATLTTALMLGFGRICKHNQYRDKISSELKRRRQAEKKDLKARLKKGRK